LKLIACLYRDYEGKILIDGKDLKLFSSEELRNHLSILFQDPMEYHLSAEENITIGKADNQDFREAAEAAAALNIIQKLSKKEKTLLGKWLHDGQELSGGEWHRIATARSLLGKKNIIIMDEPTSSLDPWAEIQWTKRIRKHLQTQTVIIITHRVSVARLADHICVMEGVFWRKGVMRR
jgi:ATP-binding cassette, subfamily B, bacterial